MAEDIKKEDSEEEWEYVDVPEGEGLPEDAEYEYEYVEVEDESEKTKDTESVIDLDLPYEEIDFPEEINVEDLMSEDTEIEEINIDDFDNDKIEIEEITLEDDLPEFNEENYFQEEVEEIEIEEIPVEDISVEEVPDEELEVIEDIPEIWEENDSNWNLELNVSTEELSAKDYQTSVGNAKMFNASGYIEVFQGNETQNSIFISAKDIDSCKLIIFDRKVLKLSEGESKKSFPLLKDSTRFAKIIKNNEEKLAFFNDEEFNFAPKNDDFGIKEGKFIFGNTSKSSLFINDFINIPLDGYKGKRVLFKEPVSGMVIGAKASILYFSKLNMVMISASDSVEKEESYDNLSWYNGTVDDSYIKISGMSKPDKIIGNEGVKNIHIETGTSTYGWNVSFDNGIMMSVRDLQMYQRKNGKMPSNNGVISYGSKKFEFNNIIRIVIYETPQYISYGK